MSNFDGGQVGFSLSARFDWYQATFADYLYQELLKAFEDSFEMKIEHCKGRTGYRRGEVWKSSGEDRLATLLLGGYGDSEGTFNLQVSSDLCDQVVPILRRFEHRVSRVDSAIDFYGSWQEWKTVTVDFGKLFNVRRRVITDSKLGGGTVYLGSPSSQTQMRLYDKSAELKNKFPERAGEIPEGLIRAELQVRPAKDVKKQASAWSPADCWAYASKWSRKFANDVLKVETAEYETRHRQLSIYENALKALGKQYGGTFARRSLEVGEDQALEEIFLALTGQL